MLKSVLWIFWAVVLVHAERTNDLLLPQTRQISGIVVDSAGKPIADAHIDHSSDDGHAYQTHPNGGFELETRAPVLVVRKPGYRSGLVHTRDTERKRVVLQGAGGETVFPRCSTNRRYVGIDGWRSAFRFPRIPGVKVGQQGYDVDYAARDYYLDTKSGPKGIRHGNGSAWSSGQPSDEEVWASIDYQEVSYEYQGRIVIDARGTLPNGQRWRSLGRMDESAFYSGLDEADAKVLDKVLDGACAQPTELDWSR